MHKKEIERQTQQNIENNGKFEGSFEGTLSWPVSSSSYGHNIITSVFGRRPAPTAGASTNHGAVDIGVSYVPVLAPAAGKSNFSKLRFRVWKLYNDRPWKWILYGIWTFIWI